ncbi:RNA polymerase sigma factor [Pseudobacillus wudalianchiensis]|uniref:RNA polymerase n=1 Tax=Pseudobacillus wudalianchiensis TaxID=1743143 RepID=A0A1B9ATB8_9BACI|nr:sigma-70 family RNA polymerase sigma factor [Bacillus wudalianchiensis]OCA87074.1 RNA polymerase [Bacillus wudalianchiensis]
MKEKSDEELIILVMKKHRSALEELYDRYIKLIYSFAFKFANGDADSTKEMVQLVFLKLWTTKSSYDSSKGKFVNWLLTITRNVCLDYIRKNSLHVKHTEQIQEHASAELTNPVDEIEQRLTLNAVLAAKSKLSTAQKRLIDLFYWKGFSLTEIAEIENEPVGTVKSRLHQSLKQLKKYLEVEDL